MVAGRAVPGGRSDHPDRALTLPNLLSLVRLACVPGFLWLLFGANDVVAAGCLLAALGTTDWVDGMAARHLGQVSTLGKVLDPAADRALLAVGAIGSVVYGALPVWVFAVVVAREALVSGGVMFLAARGGSRIDVTWLGKAGTFALMFALPLFLVGHSDLSWHQFSEDAAWAFVVLGMAGSWLAVATYLPRARQALASPGK
ncbi:MAG TPA: CDP-alcohol phosphatidyltransferase family protein [Acidimicrobiales bacterium]|jgi:cardiolipin synthase|nr:CDP-alcohol phosphatidyltransferase family protein [Acidimicrobiales bacterium]